nr:hypothetical protein Itr_chr14CG11120 [Ipomoea trifida]
MSSAICSPSRLHDHPMMVSMLGTLSLIWSTRVEASASLSRRPSWRSADRVLAERLVRFRLRTSSISASWRFSFPRRLGPRGHLRLGARGGGWGDERSVTTGRPRYLERPYFSGSRAERWRSDRPLLGSDPMSWRPPGRATLMMVGGSALKNSLRPEPEVREIGTRPRGLGFGGGLAALEERPSGVWRRQFAPRCGG